MDAAFEKALRDIEEERTDRPKLKAEWKSESIASVSYDEALRRRTVAEAELAELELARKRTKAQREEIKNGVVSRPTFEKDQDAKSLRQQSRKDIARQALSNIRTSYSRYEQGAWGEGYAVFKDGRPMALDEIVRELRLADRKGAA